MALRLMNRLPKKRSLSSITIFSIMPPGLLQLLMKTKGDFLHFIGYLNCTKNHTRLDLLLILAHARLPNYQNCYSLVLLLSKIVLLNIVKKSMKGPVKIVFSQFKLHVRY